jgi:hypothetical protein
VQSLFINTGATGRKLKHTVVCGLKTVNAWFAVSEMNSCLIAGLPAGRQAKAREYIYSRKLKHTATSGINSCLIAG